jgi:hypothetical protein
MMNNVYNLPTNLPTDFISSVIPLVKIARHRFFCFVLFFSHCNSLGKYRENISVSKYRGNISVGKIRLQFTNENIPSQDFFFKTIIVP